MNKKVREILKVGAYVFATIAFLFALAVVGGWFRREINLYFLEHWAVSWHSYEIFWTLPISVFFAQRHLNNLLKRPLKGQIKLRVQNLIVVGIMLFVIYISPFFFIHVFGFITNLLFDNVYIHFMYIRHFLLFVMWYNLIYAFERK